MNNRSIQTSSNEISNLSIIFNSAPVGMIVLDETNNIRHINDFALGFLYSIST